MKYIKYINVNIKSYTTCREYMITEYIFIVKFFYNEVTLLRSILNNLENNDVLKSKTQDVTTCNILHQHNAQSYMTSILTAYHCIG